VGIRLPNGRLMPHGSVTGRGWNSYVLQDLRSWSGTSSPISYSIAPPPPTGQQPAEKQGLLITEASRPHSVTHNTLVRTPLDELSARRRDLYLTTHNTHKRQTPTPPTGFEPAIPAGERPQIHALGLICSVVTWGKAARA